jgi:RPA family protein
MAEIRKREIAYKVRIGEILRGKPETSPYGEGREKLNFVELGDRKLLRVNIIANVIDKFISDGEKRFASLTLDDATGQINIKTFGEDVNKLQEISQGQTLTVIGLLRIFNGEVYVLPEVMKVVDPRYLLVRKLEVEKSAPKAETSREQIVAVRDLVINKIKEEEQNEGIDVEKLIMDVKASPELINQEVKKLLEDGVIYEPKPGRVRYLG